MIKAFIQSFMDVEYNFNIALWREENEEAYKRVLNEHWSFFTNGIGPLQGRPIPLPENWFANGKEQVSFVSKRTVKSIRHYERIGVSYFLCYLTGCYTYTHDKINQCLVVSDCEDTDTPAIVSRYFLTPDTESDELVLKDGDITLYWGSGEIMESLGNYVAEIC